MNPSDGCVTGSYPPAAKKEKWISDVGCTCPYGGSTLTWEEMRENVVLHKRDSMINEMRRLQGQELKSYKRQHYSWNAMANNGILSLAVSLWSGGKIKAMFYQAYLKITRQHFYFLVSSSFSVHPLQEWPRGPEEHMLSDCMVKKCSPVHIH